MKIPCVIPLPRIFEDPMKNWLAYFFRLQNRYKPKDVYFLIDQDKIRVAFNVSQRNIVKIDPSKIPKEVKKFQAQLNKFYKSKISWPDGFYEDIPLPINKKEGLEKVLAKEFGIKTISNLKEKTIEGKITVRDPPLPASLSRIKMQGLSGYHLHLYYGRIGIYK